MEINQQEQNHEKILKILTDNTKQNQETLKTLKVEKFARWITPTLFVISASTSVLHGITDIEILLSISISLLILTQISAVILIFSSIYEPIKTLTNPIGIITGQVSSEIPKDAEVIFQLSRFEKHEISYVKFKLQQKSTHMKERSQFIIGKLETIGIIPSVISLAISVYVTPTSSTSLIDGETFFYISLFCMLTYLIIVPMRYAIQRTERMISLISYAEDP